MKRERSRASGMHARARAQAYGQSSQNSDIAMQMESVLPANMLHFHNHGSSFQIFFELKICNIVTEWMDEWNKFNRILMVANIVSNSTEHLVNLVVLERKITH